MPSRQNALELLWGKVSITENMEQRTMEVWAATEEIPTGIITSALRVGFPLFPFVASPRIHIHLTHRHPYTRQDLSICLQRKRETACARNEMGTNRTIAPFSNTVPHTLVFADYCCTMSMFEILPRGYGVVTKGMPSKMPSKRWIATSRSRGRHQFMRDF